MKYIFITIITILSPIFYSSDGVWQGLHSRKTVKVESNGAPRTNKEGTSNQQMLLKTPTQEISAEWIENLWEFGFFRMYKQVPRKEGRWRKESRTVQEYWANSKDHCPPTLYSSTRCWPQRQTRHQWGPRSYCGLGCCGLSWVGMDPHFPLALVWTSW